MSPILKNWFQLEREGLEPIVFMFDPADRADTRSAWGRAQSVRERLLARGQRVTGVYVARPIRGPFGLVPLLAEASEAIAIFDEDLEELSAHQTVAKAKPWVVCRRGRGDGSHTGQTFRFETELGAKRHFNAMGRALRPGERIDLEGPEGLVIDRAECKAVAS